MEAVAEADDVLDEQGYISTHHLHAGRCAEQEPHMNKSLLLPRAQLPFLFLAALLTSVMASHGTAQQLVPRAFPQIGVESYSFTSTIMGRDYDISVGLPVGYDADADTTYPALIVTDGNRSFPQIHGAARVMSQQESQSLFVVSIGTPFEQGPDAWVRRRVHEFSPPDWDMDDPFGEVVQPFCDALEGSEPGAPCVGGAPQFLEFIVTELLPSIHQKYPIDPDRLGLFGVSAGGFFVSWAIFQDISPFNTYLISSPAMAYGDGEIIREEARYAASHSDLDVAIYMASGSLEIDSAFLEGVGQIVSGQARLTGLLRTRDYPGLVLHSEIHQGLSHSDSAVVTLIRGMRLLYTR